MLELESALSLPVSSPLPLTFNTATHSRISIVSVSNKTDWCAQEERPTIVKNKKSNLVPVREVEQWQGNQVKRPREDQAHHNIYRIKSQALMSCKNSKGKNHGVWIHSIMKESICKSSKFLWIFTSKFNLPIALALTYLWINQLLKDFEFTLALEITNLWSNKSLERDFGMKLSMNQRIAICIGHKQQWRLFISIKVAAELIESGKALKKLTVVIQVLHLKTRS
jgi:hypothetical protein